MRPEQSDLAHLAFPSWRSSPSVGRWGRRSKSTCRSRGWLARLRSISLRFPSRRVAASFTSRLDAAPNWACSSLSVAAVPWSTRRMPIAAVAKLEEDVQMRAEFLRGLNSILGNGTSELQADHIARQRQATWYRPSSMTFLRSWNRSLGSDTTRTLHPLPRRVDCAICWPPCLMAACSPSVSSPTSSSPPSLPPSSAMRWSQPTMWHRRHRVPHPSTNRHLAILFR